MFSNVCFTEYAYLWVCHLVTIKAALVMLHVWQLPWSDAACAAHTANSCWQNCYSTALVLAPYQWFKEWLLLCAHPCPPIEHIAKTCMLCLLWLHALDRSVSVDGEVTLRQLQR